jgi:phenylalanyl-tRNA synthetase alpha chain
MQTEQGSLDEELAALTRTAVADLQAIETAEALEDWRVRYLGRRGGLSRVMERLAVLPKEARPAAGQAANRAKNTLEGAFVRREEELRRAALEASLVQERLDVTLDGRRPRVGYAHPVREVLEQIKTIFLGMGFGVADGPEVEWDRYNFELLNIPADHPARDMWDTFYLEQDPRHMVLRTHTSPVQARVMEKQRPPVRVIVPGLCYRRDDDATHSPIFWQVEGLAVDTDLTFSDLKGVLARFADEILGCKVRFRPTYFPFTEPSAEFDFSCLVCGGSGIVDGRTCRVCKGEGWLEISGAGMVHPQVLRYMDYDPAVYSGFAWGMGPERLTMLKYGVSHIGQFWANDLRFRRQFR